MLSPRNTDCQASYDEPSVNHKGNDEHRRSGQVDGEEKNQKASSYEKAETCRYCHTH